MPNPAAIFLKAMLCFAVAVVLFQFAQQVGTVEVTLIADGTMTQSAVSPNDPIYRAELELARNKAKWVYVLAGCTALIGLFMVRKSVRIYRRTRPVTGRI